MAVIPYGFRVAGGKMMIMEEEAERIRRFVSFYLEGHSIKEALVMAALPLSRTGAGNVLKNRIYVPGIIDADSFERVQAERKARYERLGHFKSRGPKAPLPVKRRFRMDLSALPEGKGSPEETAAALYAAVRWCDGGKEQIGKDSGKVKNIWK